MDMIIPSNVEVKLSLKEKFKVFTDSKSLLQNLTD